MSEGRKEVGTKGGREGGRARGRKMLTQMQKWKDKRVQHSPILLRAFCGQGTVLGRAEGVRHRDPPSLGCAGGVRG